MNIQSVKINGTKVFIKASGTSQEDDVFFNLGAGLKFTKPPHVKLLRAFNAFSVLVPDVMGYNFLEQLLHTNTLSVAESAGYRSLEAKIEDNKAAITNRWTTTEVVFGVDKHNRYYCVIKGTLRNNIGNEAYIETFPVFYEEDNGMGYESIFRDHVSILKREVEVYYKTDSIQSSIFTEVDDAILDDVEE